MKRQAKKVKPPGAAVKNRAARGRSPIEKPEPTSARPAEIHDPSVILPETVLQLQKQVGNRAVQQFLSTQIAPASEAQRKEQPGVTLETALTKAIRENPSMMSGHAKDLLKRIKALLATKQPGDSYVDEMQLVAAGLSTLVADLKKLPAGSKTTAEQQKKHKKWVARWLGIKQNLESDARAAMRRQLADAKAATKKMQIHMMHAYHEANRAGINPSDVKIAETDNVRTLAEKVLDLLAEISVADAKLSGRSVAPLIPVLQKTLKIVTLSFTWKATKPFMATASADMRKVQNALNLATTPLSIVGLGKFLPMFGHFAPLLTGIAGGWDTFVKSYRIKNRTWWKIKKGESLQYSEAGPVPGPVFSYLVKMMKASSPPSDAPPKEVLNHFYKYREVINKAMKEVMGKGWDKVPTRKYWLVFAETHPGQINDWVFRNRDAIWALMCGRHYAPPKRD
jgi:hypothetical protein